MPALLQARPGHGQRRVLSGKVAPVTSATEPRLPRAARASFALTFLVVAGAPLLLTACPLLKKKDDPEAGAPQASATAAAATATATEAATAPVASLATATPHATTHHVATAPSKDGGAPATADGGAATGATTAPPGLPAGFPTTLPSGFPTALPSGFPTALPSGFPAFDAGAFKLPGQK